MRIGGPFPFNPVGSFPIALGGGQYFYPPAGNYLCTLGAQTCLQWWDPINSNWRNIARPLQAPFSIDMDGYNFRLINMSGVVSGATITAAGSSNTNGIGPTQTGVSIGFGSAPTNGQSAQGYVIVGGAVGSVGGSATVTNAGSGFKVAPLVLIDPPPAGGIQATAVANLTSAGAINAVTMVNPGAGYLTAPNFYLVPQFLDYPGQTALPYTIPSSPTPVAPNFPPGQIGIMPPQTFMQGLQLAFPVTGGAVITSPALAGSGTVTGIVITDYGALYTSVPTITFTGASGSPGATALMSWALTALTGGSGTAYTIGNTWISDMGLVNGTGSTWTGTFDNDTIVPRVARGRLTSTAGALIIEDPGFGFQQALIAANFGVAQGASIASGSIVFSAISMGGVNDTSLLQLFINQ